MGRDLSVLAVGVVFGACNGGGRFGPCGHIQCFTVDAQPPSDGAKPDASNHDASEVADGGDASEAGPNSVLLGTWRFPRPDFDLSALPRYECGTGLQATMAAPHSPTAHAVCEFRGWLYTSVNGGVARIREADGTRELLTERARNNVSPQHGASVVCRRSDLVVAVSERTPKSSAIVEFTDPTGPGVVRWVRTAEPRPEWVTGIQEHVATEALMAWTYQYNGGPLQLWVAGPHAEAPRVLVTSPSQFYPTASGSTLVFEYRDVLHRWSLGMASPERVTPEINTWQWSPWLDGDRLVWLDGRHGRGSRDTRDNPEVYFKDLRTGETRRLTHDPPERPAGQVDPTISGDWVVWSDFRDAAAPNPSTSFSDRMDLYAFNLRTGREHRLVSEQQTSLPRILGDRVAFACTIPRPVGYGQLFLVPLPRE